MSDGAQCGDGRICVSEACVASECGDGIFDSRTEQCDDGNTMAFDGCEPTCAFTCTGATDCDDGNLCNGMEGCSTTMHACQLGTPATDGTPCTNADVTDGVCGSEVCLPAGCGNGVLETGETCDDGDDDPTNGCTNDCVFTCIDDTACQDATVCNGLEACDLTTHRCMAGTAPVCDDGSPCTTDSCDDALGCTTVLVDGDMDGHAPNSLGPCGDDCDDTRADVFTGAEELCDGRDNNCNGTSDEVAPTWYIDCDADGYAAATDSSRTGCAMPAATAAGCPGTLPGGWTQRRPVDVATRDCNDLNAAFSPGVAEIPGDQVDQNCDMHELCYLDEDDDNFRRIDGRTISSTDVDCVDPDEGLASQPATDCCDTDARAFPGETMYYGTPRTTCGGFDFDCNSSSELRFIAVGGGCSGGCGTIAGWAVRGPPPPGCGISAQHFGDGSGSACMNIFSCIPLPGVLQQLCR